MTLRLWNHPRPGTRSARAARAPRAPRFHPELHSLEDRAVPSTFEVWTIDQSNTRDENGNGSIIDSVDSGGTLYIHRGSDLSGRHPDRATPEVIDLGGAARDFAVARTGTAPIRPHMMMFNSMHSHAIIANVASGHVLFLDAHTRAPVGAIDVGVQAHAAVPSPDDRYLIVANQNGKMLHRVYTNYRTNTFILDPVPLDLANGTTPSGALRQDPVLRPDNAPICPVIESSGRFTFVTLRGGGLFVVDTVSDTMRIVAEYDRATVHRDGCGGIEVGGKMYINSGGPGEADLYSFRLRDFDAIPNPPNTPAPNLVFRQGGDPTLPQFQVDSHGALLTKHDRYLWVADRWANKIVVVNTRNDRVVNEFSLVGAASNDPAPDLIAISPDGNRVFAALRGPRPLTANNPAFNNAVGSTPGVGVIRVTRGGRSGEMIAVAPISHLVDGVERADPHSIHVRMIHEGRGRDHDDDDDRGRGRDHDADRGDDHGDGLRHRRPPAMSPAAPSAVGRMHDPEPVRQDPVRVDLGRPFLDPADAVTHGVRIDDDAAGHGGFVEPTPFDDREFRKAGDTEEREHVDLLGLIAYELGHLAGLDDDRAEDITNDSPTAADEKLADTADVNQPAAVKPALSAGRLLRRR